MLVTQNSYAFFIRQLRRRLAKNTAQYQAARFLVDEVGQRVMERLSLIKVQPDVIVDIGSGMGNFSAQLRSHYPDAHVVSLDISEQNLPKRKKFWRRWQQQPAVLCADAHKLPLADASVDFIFSNMMLYQSYNLPLLFQEWQRVIKPGGLVLFSSLGPDTLKEFRQACATINTVTRVQPFIDMHDIGDILLQSGFADPVMDMEYITVYYEHFCKLLSDLKAQNILNFSANRPTSLTGKSFWQQVGAAYESFQQQHKLPATCEIIYGHAWTPLKKQQIEKAGEINIPVNKITKR